MQKNDMIELTITDLSVEGSGIGKFQGMTFFVKDTVIAVSYTHLTLPTIVGV